MQSSAVTTVTDVAADSAGTNVTSGTTDTADTAGKLYRCKQDCFAYGHLNW